MKERHGSVVDLSAVPQEPPKEIKELMAKQAQKSKPHDGKTSEDDQKKAEEGRSGQKENNNSDDK